jgi:hypothetical protein
MAIGNILLFVIPQCHQSSTFVCIALLLALTTKKHAHKQDYLPCLERITQSDILAMQYTVGSKLNQHDVAKEAIEFVTPIAFHTHTNDE